MGRVLDVKIEDEMKTSYLEYAMSVIIGRALPDIRDGLKPVQRRILFAMHELGNVFNKPHKKSARIVGEVLGKYHPHGDSAIYDALVRMAQPFSLRYVLVDGQGNFGSVDGDSAAAMRYTEVRMSKIASELLRDIDKETVEFVPNFDGTLKEPSVLPSRIPNLLINGSSGIAVGMATNIPPHNITEIIDALLAIANGADEDTVFGIIKGPDFPTGGIIVGRKGLEKAYRDGRGAIKLRGRVVLDEKNHAIKIVEIPYQITKTTIIEQIANAVKEKKINGISTIQDHSDKQGMEIFVKVKKGFDLNVVLNHLYKKTYLETTFNIINLAIVNGQPRLLSLYEMLVQFLEFRKEIVLKRSKYELRMAEERAHVLEGLKKALDMIDEVVTTIKKSKNVAEARSALINLLSITEKQANAILDMKLQRISALEREKINQELEELSKKIAFLKDVIENPASLLNVVKEELNEIKEKYGDERKTDVLDQEPGEFNEEDFVQDEDVVVFMTKRGYVKRVPLTRYRTQHRGGKGLIGTETYEDDAVKEVLVANTHDVLVFFSDAGKAYFLKTYKIPEASRYSKGMAVANLLKIEGEKLRAVVRLKPEHKFLFFSTKKGVVKRVLIDAFKSKRINGTRAISLDEDDELVEVKPTTGEDKLLIATKNGMSITIDETDVRAMGRTARGVRGIKLKKDDEVVGCVKANTFILTITKNGMGKKTPFEEYRVQKRGGTGIINLRTNQKTGDVVVVLGIGQDDEILLTTNMGRVIRFKSNDLRPLHRATSGVRLMKLKQNEEVSSAAVISI